MKIFKISTRGLMKFLYQGQSETSLGISVMEVGKLSTRDLHMIVVFDYTVMAAEVVKHFIPRLVELHNYTPANSTRQKLENWRTLSSEYIFTPWTLQYICVYFCV